MINTKYYVIDAVLKANNETLELYRELITVDTDFRKVFDIYTQYIWGENEYFGLFQSISLHTENEKGILIPEYITIIS